MTLEVVEPKVIPSTKVQRSGYLRLVLRTARHPILPSLCLEEMGKKELCLVLVYSKKDCLTQLYLKQQRK